MNITIFLSLKYLQWKIPMIEQIQWPNPGKPKFSEQQPLVSNFDVYHSEDKSNQPNPALSLCLSNFHPYSTLLKFPRHCQLWEFLDWSADSNLKTGFSKSTSNLLGQKLCKLFFNSFNCMMSASMIVIYHQIKVLISFFIGENWTSNSYSTIRPCSLPLSL